MSESNIKLFQHQKDGIEFALKNNGRCALFYEAGLGKTLTAIKLFEALRITDPKLRMLVVCPIRLIDDAWGEDIGKFTPHLSYKNLRKLKKRDTMREDILICNYEWLKSRHQKPDFQRMMGTDEWLIVLDESQAMKNHRSKTTKCLLSIAYRFKHRVVMSGTPAPNDESEYWSQVAFITTEIFHKNFYAFRNTFFHLQRGNTIMPSGPCSKGAMAEMMRQGFKYALTDDNRNKIIERLERVCHFRQKDDCLDLPDMLDRTIHIDMDADQRRHYNQMKYYSITQIREAGESIVARIALTKLMKLRQITSGFSIDEMGDVQELDKNPKLDMLMEILDEIGDKQVIIWCNFRHEIQTLMRVLGDRARSLYGGVDEEYKSDAVAGFKSGSFQYLVAHPQSAGVGLTFVNCHNQIFYSLSYSFEDYEQCRARTHRAGQKNPCMYYHLICNNSIDETIMNALKTKQSADQLVKDLLK